VTSSFATPVSKIKIQYNIQGNYFISNNSIVSLIINIKYIAIDDDEVCYIVLSSQS